MSYLILAQMITWLHIGISLQVLIIALSSEITFIRSCF
jgi:hypothetical protein